MSIKYAASLYYFKDKGVEVEIATVAHAPSHV